MSKLVCFPLSFVETLDQFETKRNAFFGRSKKKRLNHYLVEEIRNYCLTSDKVKNDIEIDQSSLSKHTFAHKRAISRFLQNGENELILGCPKIQGQRRSRDQLGVSNTPPPKKQTRFQAQLCQATNCEWKSKFEASVEENTILRNQIDMLKTKMERFESQNSTQKSSQSQPWATPTIELLQTEAVGCVTRYSVHMIRLAIFLIVSCNLSARCIPLVILGILNAAGFKNMQLPRYGYFTRIRSMLSNLNHTRMIQFCTNAKDLCICFDGSSFSTKQGSIQAISVIDHNAKSHLIAMMEHNEKAVGELQHVLDVRVIIQTLQATFGDSFETIVSKISVILSDDCKHARQLRIHLRDELDRLFPTSSKRQEKRCLIHVANLAEDYIMKKLPLLMPFLKKIAPLLSKPKNASTDSLYNVWKGHKIVYAHGSRFFVYGSNAVAVFSSYDHLFELLTKYKKSSISAAQLLQMMNDNQLYSQLAVMARLSSFVHNMWSMVTVKQSKRNLVDNIKHLQTQMEMIESNTFSLDEVVDSLSRNSEVDRDAHQKYVAEFSDNLEVQTKTREVFLHFSGKIIDLMEPYLEIEDSHSMDAETDHLDTIIDPTNLAIERAFGLMKFYERRFIQLSFGCLSALTIAKFNDLPRWLSAFNDEELLQAHDSVSTNQSVCRDVHAIQKNHMQVNTEKSLNQVIIIDIEKI